MNEYLRQALELVELGIPVLPLREGKGPFGNCDACAKNHCGGRPNMKSAGTCACPRPCHAWAAASNSVDVVTSAAWAAAWRQAGAVAYHPGGTGVTVVDLDNAHAVSWAHDALPATRTVATTRGEHWIYLGTMQSSNGVRPGVDIKSLMSYARWLGPGVGEMIRLPETVTALPRYVVPTGAVASSPDAPRFVDSGRGVRVPAHRAVRPNRPSTRVSQWSLATVSRVLPARRLASHGSSARSTGSALVRAAWRRWAGEIIAAAASVGVPESYAARAVDRGFAEAGAQVPTTQMA